MDIWRRCSRHALADDLLQGYRGECLDRTMCLLTRLRRSPLLLEDPNGTAALAFLRAHRRDLRRLRRRGLPPHHRVTETAASYAPTAWAPAALPAGEHLEERAPPAGSPTPPPGERLAAWPVDSVR